MWGRGSRESKRRGSSNATRAPVGENDSFAKDAPWGAGAANGSAKALGAAAAADARGDTGAANAVSGAGGAGGAGGAAAATAADVGAENGSGTLSALEAAGTTGAGIGIGAGAGAGASCCCCAA